MNCEMLPLWLNAALDDELSPADTQAMQQHLAYCSACREEWLEWQGLHQDLQAAVQAPAADAIIQQVLQAISGQASEKVRPLTNDRARSSRPSVRNSTFALLVVASSLVIAAVFMLQLSTATPAIAEIAMATGPIEFMPANGMGWIAADGKSKVHLAANSRVRTPSNSLCEIRTRSDAVVRLNQATELVLRRPEMVELVAGELWCRAPETSGMKISGSPASQTVGASHPAVFTCPSSTEMQWRAMPEQGLTCLDVYTSAVRIESTQASCTIQPGECVSFSGGKATSETMPRTDPFQATSWQLPLLALREPLDVELQQRLQGILAIVGRSKAAYFYEDQIRQLGPAGTLPLLAFVRSPESRADPNLRMRAMHFIAESATQASLPQLQELARDEDPVVKNLATQTVARLQAGQSTQD